MIGPIDLPYPHKDLSPNARVHHMALHRAKKAAKESAEWLTRAAKPHGWQHDGSPLTIAVAWHPVAGKAAPDHDNAIATIKGHLDGIAKGLGVNDKLFRPILTMADAKPNGGLSFIIMPEGSNG